jgi:glycosyltransferase involved in cell wall biosynthesis
LPKGQDLIIKALHRATCTKLKVFFLGEGPARSELEALAHSLGVSTLCRFVGVADAVEFFAIADFVVMPSRFEGFSIAAIEAACAGCPLILTDIPAFSSFIGPGTQLVLPGSVTDLAGSFRRSVAERQQFKMAALAAASAYQAQFDIRKVAEEYIGLYKELGAGRGWSNV